MWKYDWCRLCNKNSLFDHDCYPGGHRYRNDYHNSSPQVNLTEKNNFKFGTINLPWSFAFCGYYRIIKARKHNRRAGYFQNNDTVKSSAQLSFFGGKKTAGCTSTAQLYDCWRRLSLRRTIRDEPVGIKQSVWPSLPYCYFL